ncbi:flagellar filament outer layer protein FlaA [Thermospira aquatica]|uniref:Flagellar filament outer layer protein FlaA n=1 Tax=Thermospira aquatica TaxID=2828656 RepID=A0AAX3BB53_9SPIR|nr:flagellar filament outer layer protein FlaA [Thermospira aquatica]URA09356.1 hypothetical protein KDW03_07625 [Thermospira aquatica]
MRYKGIWLITLLTMLLFFGYTSSLFGWGFSDRDRETVNLQTFLISDFGDEKDQTNNLVWKARFSRFAKPSNIMDPGSPVDPEACNSAYFAGKPLGIPEEMEQRQKWVLGVKAQYVRKGYNYVEIIPYHLARAGVDANGKPSNVGDVKETNVSLVGVVKSLDMWLWGGNYNYWLEFYLRDYKGFLHRVPAGDIKFVGWKNLRTTVPSYIPQAQNHVPFLKPLKLEMIKLWSHPEERVDQFYVYLDYLQVQTDVYLERFNGDDLANNRW